LNEFEGLFGWSNGISKREWTELEGSWREVLWLEDGKKGEGRRGKWEEIECYEWFKARWSVVDEGNQGK
jgi:hypothetical protein